MKRMGEVWNEVPSTSDRRVIPEVKTNPETPALPLHIKLKIGEEDDHGQ
jgi:hypothetical protein